MDVIFQYFSGLPGTSVMITCGQNRKSCGSLRMQISVNEERSQFLVGMLQSSVLGAAMLKILHTLRCLSNLRPTCC